MGALVSGEVGGVVEVVRGVKGVVWIDQEIDLVGSSLLGIEVGVD